MSEFHDNDFAEPIRDMADDAIRRMYAIQEGHLDGMHDNDIYRSDIISRGQSPKRVDSEMTLYTELVGHIDPSMIDAAEPAPYFGSVLSRSMIVLAEHALHRRRDRTTRIIPTHESAQSELFTQWILSSEYRRKRERFAVFSADMGSIGITRVMLDYAGDDQTWRLGYEGRLRRVVLLNEWDDPDDPAVAIVESDD